MQISRDFTIAVHTLLCIEYFKTAQKATSEFIASSVGVNPVIIRNIIAKLKNSKLVASKQGVSGITLAQPASQITLLDIYKAIGANEKPVINFHEHPNKKCPVGANIHNALDTCIAEATSALEKKLQTKKLSDLLKRIRER